MVETRSPEVTERITTEGTQAEETGGQIIHEIAELAFISGNSNGLMATNELDIADKMIAISITDEDKRQILEELKNL